MFQPFQRTVEITSLNALVKSAVKCLSERGIELKCLSEGGPEVKCLSQGGNVHRIKCLSQGRKGGLSLC